MSSWRYEHGCLSAYCLIFVGLAAQTSILGATLDGLAVLYGETDDGATALSESMMGRGAGYLLGTVGTGLLYDKYPAKAHLLLFLSLLILAIATALIPLYPNAGRGPGAAPGTGRWLLLLALLFQATVAGSVDLGGNVLLTRVFASDVHRLTPRMNLLHLAWGVGATLGPLMAVGLGLSEDRLAVTYGTIAGIGVVLSLPLLFLKSPRQVMRLGGASDKNSDKEEVGKEDDASTKKAAQRRPGVTRSIVFLCLFYFFYAGVERIVGDWIAVFSSNAPVAVSKETAALTVSVYFGSMSIGRLIAALLTSRRRWARVLTPERMIGSCLFLALASMIVLALSGAYHVGGLFAGVAGIGLSLSSMYPGAITLAQSRFQATGAQTGIFVAGAPLGGLVWPFTIGVLMRGISSLAMPWAGIVLGSCCVVCFIVVLCTTVPPALLRNTELDVGGATRVDSIKVEEVKPPASVELA
jgi:fucose permease